MSLKEAGETYFYFGTKVAWRAPIVYIVAF